MDYDPHNVYDRGDSKSNRIENDEVECRESKKENMLIKNSNQGRVKN